MPSREVTEDLSYCEKAQTGIWINLGFGLEVMTFNFVGNLRSTMAVLGMALVMSNGSLASGGWVIERDDRADSPLLKDRKAIALTPEQQEQRTLALAYQKALQEEQARIRQHWPSAEVSDQTHWVAYSKDYLTRKTVDFERNQIEISIDGLYSGGRLDFAAMAKKVQGELEHSLGTAMQAALDNDPIHVALDQTLIRLGAPRQALETSGELVLKELFASQRPTQADIRAKAASLMRNASIRYQALSASVAAVPVNTGRKLTYVIPLPDNRIRKKVQEYKPWVDRNAERFALSEDIVMAIIHTESYFNPLARSHVPAFGLMQIVPSTAGRDAAAKLGKTPSVLTAQYLYNPRHNIEVGAAYLSVLYYDYLKDIKNPESRLYFAIASYNAGASSAARAFVDKPSFKDAVVVINRMKPEQVLDRLVKAAPSEETRQYVSKVLKRRNFYART